LHLDAADVSIDPMARWTGVIALTLAACGAPPRVQHAGEERVAAIEIEGNHAIASAALLDGLAISRHQNRGVDDYQVAVDVTRITGAYQKRGYFAVDVKSRIEQEGDSTTVVFTVVEGPRATARVELAGLPAASTPRARDR